MGTHLLETQVMANVDCQRFMRVVELYILRIRVNL